MYKRQVQTIRLLYEFLTGTLGNMEMPTDLFIEIFQMFKRLKGEVMPLPDVYKRQPIRCLNLIDAIMMVLSINSRLVTPANGNCCGI